MQASVIKTKEEIKDVQYISNRVRSSTFAVCDVRLLSLHTRRKIASTSCAAKPDGDFLLIIVDPVLCVRDDVL